jgi:hypothetical protein
MSSSQAPRNCLTGKTGERIISEERMLQDGAGLPSAGHPEKRLPATSS